jgi:hypothetical protein
MQTELKEPRFEETFSETIFLYVYNTDVNEVPQSVKEYISITVRTGLTLLQLQFTFTLHSTQIYQTCLYFKIYCFALR